MPPKNALATCCKENVAEESCRDVQQKSPYRDVLQNSWRNLCKDVRVDCLYRRVGEECQISRCWREALEKFQSSSRSRSMVLCYHHVKRRINPLIIGVQKSCTLQIKSTGFSSSMVRRFKKGMCKHCKHCKHTIIGFLCFKRQQAAVEKSNKKWCRPSLFNPAALRPGWQASSSSSQHPH